VARKVVFGVEAPLLCYLIGLGTARGRADVDTLAAGVMQQPE
jgi:hypothetical protein